MLEVVIRNEAYTCFYRVPCTSDERTAICRAFQYIPMTRAPHPEYNPVRPLVFNVSRMIARGGSLYGGLSTSVANRLSAGPTFPPNCERVFTNSVGYVMKLPSCSMSVHHHVLQYKPRTHASTAPAVVPAIIECSGFSFFEGIFVQGGEYRQWMQEERSGPSSDPRSQVHVTSVCTFPTNAHMRPLLRDHDSTTLSLTHAHTSL
jgi:hypothetical protein